MAVCVSLLDVRKLCRFQKKMGSLSLGRELKDFSAVNLDKPPAHINVSVSQLDDGPDIAPNLKFHGAKFTRFVGL